VQPVGDTTLPVCVLNCVMSVGQCLLSVVWSLRRPLRAALMTRLLSLCVCASVLCLLLRFPALL